MIVLGIESSCDDTAIALVENGKKVLSSLISSQWDEHKKFGGVVPEIAARSHLSSITPLFRQAIQSAGISEQDIDLIAVTQGPGLIGALLVGISFAKGLSSALQKPLMPVNHIHGHIHGAILGLGQDLPDEQVFPCLALVASGGHTNLYYMKSPVHFSLLSATKDDACGECFDKVAKLLDLGYPGGPAIERLATDGQRHAFKVPKAMNHKDDLMFSYSGIKTFMANLINQYKLKGQELPLADLCSSFQEEALMQIIRKINQAKSIVPEKPKSLLIAGGVAANQRFRQLAAEHVSLKSYFPPLKYCSDNAAMIAALAWQHFQQQDDKIRSALEGSLIWDAFPRYPFEEYLFDPS